MSCRVLAWRGQGLGLQDFWARSARNGAEGAILEKISDFFRKITEVSEKFSKFPKNFQSFRKISEISEKFPTKNFFVEKFSKKNIFGKLFFYTFLVQPSGRVGSSTMTKSPFVAILWIFVSCFTFFWLFLWATLQAWLKLSLAICFEPNCCHHKGTTFHLDSLWPTDCIADKFTDLSLVIWPGNVLLQ